MKHFVKNMLIGLLIILTIGVQPIYAEDYDLNTYVYNHLENWDTEFEINYFNSDVLNLVKEIAKKDGYVYLSLKRLYYESTGYNATVKITYLTTKEQEEYVDKELKKAVNSIIKDDMTDFDKVKAINDYIISIYEYDNSLVSNTAYSALTTGKTVCQGYAATACKMLNLAGVENKVITGQLEGVGHGWNLVKLDGKWYHLDVTNNDVTNNKYFLKSDYVLRSSGFTWEAGDYPACDENYEDNSSYYERIASNLKKIGNNIKNTSKSIQDENNYGQTSKNYKSDVDGKWYLSNGVWHFLKNIGIYAIRWNLIDNKWYYLGDNGEMQTGWIYSSGKWYYCYPDSGAMATNTIVEGCRIDANGVWIA